MVELRVSWVNFSHIRCAYPAAILLLSCMVEEIDESQRKKLRDRKVPRHVFFYKSKPVYREVLTWYPSLLCFELSVVIAFSGSAGKPAGRTSSFCEVPGVKQRGTRGSRCEASHKAKLRASWKAYPTAGCVHKGKSALRLSLWALGYFADSLKTWTVIIIIIIAIDYSSITFYMYYKV